MLLKNLCALATLSSAVLSSSCSPFPAEEDVEVAHLVPEILATHEFDESAFTQGLEVDGDQLIVGTGQYGTSEIYRTTLDGVKSNVQPLDDQYFGEGITRAGEHVWQLTWKAGIAFKRDAETLDVVEEVSYAGQGWGLCAQDDGALIMSDGTSQVRHLDPVTFDESSRVTVTLDDEPVESINELECVDGMVYANLFTETDIIQFDPATGKVAAVIDASNLPNNAAADSNNVLNGIAHIPGTDRFYLAGKRWPDLYEVRFVDAG
ncbi:MAG: glutaminyl-peptide cyclotransferase [Corynebacterium sp.]|uniref:glutaminyl-peptide cyclotransferase n=1 Tax=uncultured Corynebacterium sp. TaxID=159447 RepID=UPI0017C27611|nr:glutaminyl-peptide cyclotransferase [uncultured Corynebacterium sp.]NLZ58361.1 glutaminyl-peptide cyclotransferase [Corynebacterium sp.]